MEQFLVLILTNYIMELQELKQEEIIAIYGGSEASNSLMYYIGAICKGFAYFASGTSDGGYAYCKCGM